MLDVAINRKHQTKHLIIETEEQIINVLLLVKFLITNISKNTVSKPINNVKQ